MAQRDGKITPMSFGLPLIPAILIVMQLFFCAREARGYPPFPVDEESIALHNLHTVFGQNTGLGMSKEAGAESTPAQDATMIIMDIRRKWDQWSPEFRKIAGGYFLTKPLPAPSTSLRASQTPSFEESGENRTMSKVLNLSGGKAVLGGMHLLPNWVETANFSIEWGNNLNSSDNIRYSDEILACSREPCTWIPDVVDSWADYFEEVWAKEIGVLGYKGPTGTETYLYDIYIANTADNKIGNDDDRTPTLGFNYLGITTTYCADNNVCKQDITNSHSYVIVNNYIQNIETFKTTAAHEFFHAIQFSYPTFNDWFSRENHWWIEATATWMEEAVYDDVNAYYPRVRSWLKAPRLSLKNSGDHEYGDALFIIFLTDVYLADKDFVKHVWENIDTGIQAIDNVLADTYNKGDFESAFKEFTALNAVASIGFSKGGYEEGPQYGRAAITKLHDQYPVPSITIFGESAPYELGANYIQFLPADNHDNSLMIEFDGEDGINFGTMIVKVRSDDMGFESEEIPLDPQTRYGCQSVEGFGTTYSEIFLVPAVLVNPGLSESGSYTYRANLNSACENTPDLHLTQSDSEAGSSTMNKSERRCFIATAAFGSSESPYVKILREFRDRYLMPYSAGMKLVDFYYSVSPPIADFIEDHPPAAFLVRIALLPAVGMSFLLIKTTFLEKIIIVIAVVVAMMMLPAVLRPSLFRKSLFRKLTK